MMRAWPLAAIGGGTPPTSTASVPTALSPRCLDVETDIAKQVPEAKPASVQIDLDGDGVLDRVFIGYCSMMGGNYLGVAGTVTVVSWAALPPAG
jgi:hypothetical protein